MFENNNENDSTQQQHEQNGYRHKGMPYMESALNGSAIESKIQ